jgi:hypothetical protein
MPGVLKVKVDGEWISIIPGKTGPVGPPGPPGAPGPAGSILTGASAPTAITGVTGDFYIDTTNDNMYGPKAANGTWPLALEGGAGADEVWISPSQPSTPGMELWYDTDENPPPVVNEVAIQPGPPSTAPGGPVLWVDSNAQLLYALIDGEWTVIGGGSATGFSLLTAGPTIAVYDALSAGSSMTFPPTPPAPTSALVMDIRDISFIPGADTFPAPPVLAEAAVVTIT